MIDSETTVRESFRWRALIAFAQGALLWWLYRSIELKNWPATDHGWLIGLIAAAILVPVAHFLIVDITNDRRRLWVLPPLALALFGFGWHAGTWTAHDLGLGYFSFALALAVLVFHALPFIQSWLATRRIRPNYEDLFHFAWRNTLLLAFGGIFCGVFWLLLWLWGALFGMLGVKFFADLFAKSWFAIPVTSVAAGVGMQLVGSVERLQNVLRLQLLTMLKWLTPLAILILAMFTATLLAKSPNLFVEHRRIISSAWLLWLVALTVCLLNTAYQDGRSEAPYPRWLGKAIRLIVPFLVPVSLLAAFAIAVRVDDYGLSVARVWGMLVAVTAIAYGLGYSWAPLRRDAWMGGMGAVNVAIALMTIALLTLMLTPILSPERLAAASQYGRVLDGSADDGTYQYLRFYSGEYGRARLQRLAELQGHPQADAIRTLAQLEIKKRSPYRPAPTPELTSEFFEVFPVGHVLDGGLLAALGKSTDSSFLRYCSPDAQCLVLFVDLNRDRKAEALVFSDYGTIAALRKGEGWTVLNRMAHLGASGSFNDRKALKQALAGGHYVVRDLDWQVLEIGGELHMYEDTEPKPAVEGAQVIKQAQ